MEEQLTPLLINIIERNQDYQVNINILEKYYQLFDKKKYLGSSFEEIYNDMREVYILDLQSLRYRYNNVNEQTIYKNLILAIINETDTKKKNKLIPLIIYLDNNRIFYDYLYQINYFDDFVYDIKDFFIGTISNSGVSIDNIEELSSYHQEKEWFENYKKGIESLNFKQIYSFVEGVERGIGYRSDIYVDFLTFISYKYFFDDLIRIVNNKKDMFELIYLINILNTEETLKLALKSNNYLLKFESIRRCVYFKSNNFSCLNLLQNERKLIGNIVIQLSKETNTWKQFLYYFFEYPLRSVQLFHPISQVIELIDVKNRDFILEAFQIDRYLNDNSKEALNNLFLNIRNDEIQKYFIMQIFDKWEKYIEQYNEYFDGLLLTNVIDLVIIYVKNFLDKDKAVQEIKKILYELSEIDNKWFKDRMEYKNYFYKKMTLLFVYSWIIPKYNLADLKEEIKSFCLSSFILKKERISENQKTTLKLFNDYILVKVNND